MKRLTQSDIKLHLPKVPWCLMGVVVRVPFALILPNELGSLDKQLP